ncbi:hypothetical protein HMPREF3291_00450 [Bacillus sp. HMSC76G11]|nr:hypothetical protein HMPREF3291_00450 [Bacillus sp. HMSC76G11]
MVRYSYIFRKWIAVFITSFFFTGYILTGGYVFFELNMDNFFWFIIIFFISTIVSLAYGFPISITAELLTKKITSYHLRVFVSGLIHLSGGLLFYVISTEFYIYAIYCSIIFFLTDEGLRLLDKKVFYPCLKDWN